MSYAATMVRPPLKVKRHSPGMNQGEAAPKGCAASKWRAASAVERERVFQTLKPLNSVPDGRAIVLLFTA